MLDWLKGILNFLGEMLGWVVDFFQWLFVKVAVLVFDAIIAVLSLIPVPEWMANLSSNMGSIGSGFLFFIAPFEFGTGMTWVVSAYLLRFLIRRLPVVG
jgi:hypothetical protein